MDIDELHFESETRGLLHRKEKSSSTLGSIRQSVNTSLGRRVRREATYQPGLANCALIGNMKPGIDQQPKTSYSRIKPNLTGTSKQLHSSTESTNKKIASTDQENHIKKIPVDKCLNDGSNNSDQDQNSLTFLQNESNDLMLDESDEELKQTLCESQKYLIEADVNDSVSVIIDNSPIQQTKKKVSVETLKPSSFDLPPSFCNNSHYKSSTEPKNLITYDKLKSGKKKIQELTIENDDFLPSLSIDNSADSAPTSVITSENNSFFGGSSKLKESKSDSSVSLTIKRCYLVRNNKCKSLTSSTGGISRITIFSNNILLQISSQYNNDKKIVLKLNQIVRVQGAYHNVRRDHFVFLIYFVDMPREVCEFVRSQFVRIHSSDESTTSGSMKTVKGELLVICKNVSFPLLIPLESKFCFVEWEKFQKSIERFTNFDSNSLTLVNTYTKGFTFASTLKEPVALADNDDGGVDHKLTPRKTRLQTSSVSTQHRMCQSPIKNTKYSSPKRPAYNLPNETSLASLLEREQPDWNNNGRNLLTRSDSVILSYPFEELPSGNKTTIFQSDIPRLKPNVYLNDSLISLYLIYLEEQFASQHDIHFFNTHFYSRLANKGCESALQWLREPVLKKKFWIIPINEALHWYLAIVCFPGTCIGWNYDEEGATVIENHHLLNNPYPTTYVLILNSLNIYQRTKDFAVSDTIHRFIEAQAQAFQYELVDNWNISPLFPSNIPQQTNTHDCGCFLLENVEMFLQEGPESSLDTFLALNAVNLVDKETDVPSWYPYTNARKKRTQLSRLLQELTKDPRNKIHLSCDLVSKQELTDSEEIEELSEGEYNSMIQKSN